MGELRGDALSNGRDNRNTKASYVHETTVDGNGKELATEGSPGELVLHGDTIARSKRQRLSGWFTIACAGFALISDGYQNNLMTMLNVLLTVEYPADYTSEVSTRVSNALLVGAIVGQIVVGLICDRLGRKIALVTTTFLIIVGTSLVAGSVGPTTAGMFWMMTVARGITGFGVSCLDIFHILTNRLAANIPLLVHLQPKLLMKMHKRTVDLYLFWSRICRFRLAALLPFLSS